MPLYGTGYIFSKKFFTGWVTVGIIWIFISFFAVCIFPAYEGRATVLRICKILFLHGGKVPVEEPVVEGMSPVLVEGGSGAVTPEKGTDTKGL